MKRIQFTRTIRKLSVLMITVVTFLQFTSASTKPEKEPSVYDHRMGVLTVKAKPGASVTIEQVAHEFWFGCAIPNSLVDDSMTDTDKKQFEEKFIQHFNSAVTENAIKWGTMER